MVQNNIQFNDGNIREELLRHLITNGKAKCSTASPTSVAKYFPTELNYAFDVENKLKQMNRMFDPRKGYFNLSSSNALQEEVVK